jgi:hypothetical protein
MLVSALTGLAALAVITALSRQTIADGGGEADEPVPVRSVPASSS